MAACKKENGSQNWVKFGKTLSALYSRRVDAPAMSGMPLES
jgi:hypothetical protein